MNSRLISIIRKEFIQITRDPRTLVLIVVMPRLSDAGPGFPKPERLQRG